MTLVYGTGWDLCASFADAALEGWTSSGGGGGSTVDIQTSNGRGGIACCLRVQRGNGAGNNPVGALRIMGTQSGQCFVGFAANATSTGSSNMLVAFLDSGTAQIQLGLTSTGGLTLARNGTTIGSAPAGTVTYGTYHYWELSFIVASGTGGSVTVRRDMTTVINVSGINTQASANASWNQIVFGGDSGTGQLPVQVDHRYDDMYFCNASGSVNNTFLGDVGLRAELPNGAGTNSNFTRTGGSAGGNFTAVNEKPNDADTSYVAASTIGTIDTYLYPALSVRTSSIFGVIAKPIARKDDAGNRHITAHYRAAGGSEADFGAPDITLTSNYAESIQIQETNPVTASAWLVSDISGGEFGPAISS